MFAETTDVTVVDNVYILKSFILANFNQTWSCIIALHRRLYVTAVAYISCVIPFLSEMSDLILSLPHYNRYSDLCTPCNRHSPQF